MGSPVTPSGGSTVPAQGKGVKITVTWPNADTPLLPEKGASVTLSADGAALSPVRIAKGLRVFSLPDGSSKVQLTASFTASFPAVNGTAPQNGGTISAPALSAEVLRADQTYTVNSGQLTADTIPDYGGPHPLIVTGATAAGQSVAITVRTEFVDVSTFWPQYCASWSYYLSEHQSGTTTFVLGYTGGMPVVWFAIVPDAMATFSNGFTSCLVFYRPANYVYSRLNQPHNASAVGRYFLKPKPDSDSAAQFWERDHLQASDGYHLMRCRFEDAIVQSQRALVMLHPWPSGTGFGAAQQAGLGTLCGRAIGFLWASKRICKSVAEVQIGRLGLSGFSAGGSALWPALSANAAQVREVYGFDCTGTGGASAQIVQWFNSHDTNFLRLVNGSSKPAPNGYNFGTHAGIQQSLDPKQTGRKDLTVVPASATEYAPGNNSMYEHYISPRPDLRDDEDTQHQWAISGGELVFGKMGAYDLDQVETYFLRFLRASGFLHF